ncbi:ATP-grasp domain-containing protein, partial [Enterococcus faecalis]|uniref:ATP-grasp domain-containing protein n=1 Tax=Enterococcus faecalis TaxID=1351 RepID=UPI0025B091C7
LAQALEKMTHQPIDPAQGVLISDLQNLGREFRMFVVDGEVIDIAEYRNRGHVQHKKVYAQDADKLRAYHRTVHHPTAPRAYVMDVCEVVEDVTDLRIVELNCLNCSGPYTVDRAQVYSAVAKAV